MGITVRKLTVLGSAMTGYVPPAPPPPELWLFNSQTLLPAVGGPGECVISMEHFSGPEAWDSTWRAGDTITQYPSAGKTLTVIGELFYGGESRAPVLSDTFSSTPSPGDLIKAVKKTGNDNTPVTLNLGDIGYCNISAAKGEMIVIMMRNYDFSSPPSGFQLYKAGGSGWITISSISSTYQSSQSNEAGDDLGTSRYFLVPDTPALGLGSKQIAIAAIRVV